jgi:hypothetical protein
MIERTTGARRRAFPGTALLLVLALGASACSGDEAEPDDPESSGAAQEMATDQPVEFQVETRASLGRVVGRLPKKDRDVLVNRVSAVVEGWFRAAYGGSYPRSGFADAYPGFTTAARREARRDKKLMSNVGIGDRITGVTPTESRVHVDVLAARGHAAGVTARFLLRFRTEGDVTKHVRVQGRLLMSRSENGWRIFGYHVSRGARA